MVGERALAFGNAVTSDAAMPLPLIILAAAAAVLLAYQFITADMQPFIYFQF
ncbi:MAG: hypothetical protein J6P74_04525 [Paludibacteraceae bacterium]|nr:hypothetical protein [Paludibacteraceae bacterium]